MYNKFFNDFEWTIIPQSKNKESESSYHLYMLRINGITENQRDNMIQYLYENEVATNVHYIPMPLFTLFKDLGYKIKDYPNTYKLFTNEITLPVYNGLTEQELIKVCQTVVDAYKSIFSNQN